MTSAEPRRRSWPGLAQLVGPALLAALVGAWSITRPALWRDESVSVHFAREPLGDAWREWGEVDAVHAAYDLLLRLTIWIDPVELGVRLPSLVGFVVATVGVVLVGRRLMGRTAATCAGVVYAILPVTSRFAQEGRSYALVSMVAVLSALALLRMVEQPSPGRVVAYSASVAALGCLHLYALLLLAAHGAYVLLAARQIARRVALAWAGAAVVLLPLAVVAAGQRAGQLGWIRRPGLSELRGLVDQIGGTDVATVVLALLAVSGAWVLRRSPLPLLWAVLPVAVSWLVSQVQPVYADRYVLYVVPAVALLVGAGADGVARLLGRGRPVALGAILVVVALAVLPGHRDIRAPDRRPDDLRSLTRDLAAEIAPGDAVVAVPASFLKFVDAYEGPFERLVVAQADSVPVGTDRVWVVTRGYPSHRGAPELARLNRDFHREQVRSYGVTSLSLWTLRTPSA
ncbi:hypothetical protein GEV27_04315 [Aeromicrobium sp. S22]|uniref:glycosyltransferase family 39 protein n=1 Tax=Aeromicrobium sp. S22 TaxID=2662029 RepID=UPI00129D8084|nr:glycosyltransferase family 39 protein [Aeromicrobium sp. S22]MRK00741.1 hypothetical protein [Aeromicrobium sp. S22]